MSRKKMPHRSSTALAAALAREVTALAVDKTPVSGPTKNVVNSIERKNAGKHVRKAVLKAGKIETDGSAKRSVETTTRTSARGSAARRSGRHLALRAWVLSGLLALALSLVVGNQVYAQVQQANDEAAVKQVVLTAVGASLQAVVVPHARRVSPLVASPKLALAASSADLAVAQTQAHALFKRVYDAKCVPCQAAANKTYQTLQSESSGTFRALAWAVRDVVWQQVFLNSQTASITVSATLWSEVQYVDEFGKLNTVTPTGGEVMIYTLTKTGSTWLITNQVPDDTASSNLPVNQQKPNGQSGPPPTGQPTPVKSNLKVKK